MQSRSQKEAQINLPGREVWRPVPIEGWNDRFSISSRGRIKSLDWKRSGRERILYTNNHRYETVVLKKNCVRRSFEIHRLVALAFPEICGENKPGMEVHHIDGNRLNNLAINLKFIDMHKHRARHNHNRRRQYA